MLHILDRAGVTTNVSSLFTSIQLILIQLFKIRHVTMNNLQTNTKAMEDLEILLCTCEIPFDAKEQCVMCFSHIVNIICQHVIAKMSSSALPEDIVIIRRPFPKHKHHCLHWRSHSSMPKNCYSYPFIWTVS